MCLPYNKKSNNFPDTGMSFAVVLNNDAGIKKEIILLIIREKDISLQSWNSIIIFF